jgi:cyanophycin synthetase
VIDAYQVPESAFTGTTRLIIQEAKQRGWKVTVLQPGASRLFIDCGDNQIRHVFGSMLPSLSYNAASLSNNKQLTTEFLSMHGITQLESLFIDVAEEPERIQQLLDKHTSLVVKPYDGAHGDGIRLNATTIEDVQSAAQNALLHSSAQRKVIVQQQFQNKDNFDIRLLCIDHTFVAAINRIPARVYGDDTHDILELINLENEKAERGEPYKTRLALIDIERSKRYLGEAIHAIPKMGEEVRVMDVANYGAGGELVDITDNIPEWMKREAELASKVIGLPVAGVDYLASVIPTSTIDRNDIEAYIIEINRSPSLAIHDEPHFGKNRQTVSKMLDLLVRT